MNIIWGNHGTKKNPKNGIFLVVLHKAGKADSEDANEIWAEIPSMSEIYVEVDNEEEAISIILKILSEKNFESLKDVELERAY